MRLVFIYGPPASGKLTVATELAKLTGFKLFHNHVSIQFVQSIFEFGTKTFRRLTGKYRLEMIEEAAREGIDTIFTFVYSKGEDDRFVKRVSKRSDRIEVKCASYGSIASEKNWLGVSRRVEGEGWEKLVLRRC